MSGGWSGRANLNLFQRNSGSETDDFIEPGISAWVTIGAGSMSRDIFIKRGGSLDIVHRNIDNLDLTALKHQLDAEFGPGELFLEDQDEPLAHDHEFASGGIFLHYNRCKRIDVTVRYAGKTFKHGFAPSVTLKKIKHRVEKKLDIDAADAIELSLQIAGTTDRPDEATHVGSLASSPTCAVIFDLVPSDRING